MAAASPPPYLTEVTRVGSRQWRNTVAQLLVDVELSAADAATFEGSLRCRTTHGVRFADARTSPCHSRADPGRLDRTDPAYILCYQVAGSGWIRQSGREAHLFPGHLALYTTTRPADVAFGEGFHALSLRIPAHYLDLPSAAIESLASTVFPADHSLGPVLTGYLERVPGLLDEGTPEVRHHAVRTGISLFATLVGSLLQSAEPQPDPARTNGLARQTRMYVDAHLADPGLCPVVIARELHVSVRQLHKSFDAGDTVGAYIRRQRLSRCARDLVDQSLHHQGVAEIGRRWGFESASHFGQLFRRSHGTSPAAFRRDHAVPDRVA